MAVSASNWVTASPPGSRRAPAARRTAAAAAAKPGSSIGAPWIWMRSGQSVTCGET